MSRAKTTIPSVEMPVAGPWDNVTKTGNFDKSRSTIDRIIIHTMDGTTAGAAARFNNPSQCVSAHYGIKLDGTLIHWLEEYWTAYHSGNYAMNQRSIGIEHEDNGNYNDSVRTDAQYDTSARLVADICSFYGILCDRDHILKHNQVIATGCPDGLDIDRIVRQAQAILNPVPINNSNIQSYTRNVTVTAGPGVNVRDDYRLSGNIVNKVPSGGTIAVDGFVVGENVSGNNIWYKVKGAQQFFWSGATNIPSPTVTPDPAPAPVQAAPASPQVEQTPAPAPQITPEVVTPVVDNSVDNNKPPVDNPVMPPVISGQSVEDLAAKNQQLAERNKELVNASLEKDKTIELQSAQLTKVNKTVENMKQDLGNIGMYKKANEVMSGQVEAYKLKIGEYKSNLETAYQDAFAGWKLVETSPGIKGLFTLLPTTIKLFFSLVTALSHSHVIAIKKDAKILSSLPEEITSQGKTAS